MSKRSSSSASVIGAIVVIGLIARLLAAIWLYLVIGGAIVFLVWMAMALSRRVRATPGAPRAAPVVAPVSSSPPGEQLRPLLPVDPTVFDDPAKTREAAIQNFVAWARQLPMAPENPSDLVRAVEPGAQYIGRLASTIAERKVMPREAPHRGVLPVTGPRLAQNAVDPWAFSPETLRNASLYVAPCTPCAGKGLVPCSTCNGSMNARCPGCDGAGKAYGYASNGSRRLMNCKQCRAEGVIGCTACTEGKVTCRTCGRTGRIEHWFELTETSRGVVQAALDSEELQAFRWSAAETQAAPAEIEADARLLGERTTPGAISEEQAAELAPLAWLQANWRKLQPGLRPGERIQSQTLWLFEVPSVQLSYSLAAAPPTVISFKGRRMLAPPASVDRQFEARAQKIRFVRRALLVLGIGIPLAYLLRSFYFWNGWVGALTVCVAGAAVAGDRFMREVTLGREQARRWAATAATASILACGLAVGAEPSLRAAERHLSAGQLEAARKELTALGDPDKNAQAWAALNLAHALGSNDVGAIARDAALIPEGLQQRATAEQRLYELTHDSVLQNLSQKNLGAARATLAQATPVLQGNKKEQPFGTGLADLNARLKDAEFEACETDACRWRAAFEAARTVPSPVREQRLGGARAKVMDGLRPQPHSGEPTLSWLQRLDTANALAKALGQTPGDDELGTRVRATASWTHDERRKIPLIGAERAVAAHLLGVPVHGDTPTLYTVTSSVMAYCWMKAGRCVGVYLIGSTRGARELNDSAHAEASAELLSQAVGHPTALPSPPSPVGGKMPTLTRWKDRGVTLVARWRDSSLIELRIGDVRP